MNYEFYKRIVQNLLFKLLIYYIHFYFKRLYFKDYTLKIIL